MLDSIGALLRAWRLHAGWTQRHVADVTGATIPAVSSWESDTHRPPVEALETLDRVYGAGGALVDLVRALGTPVGYMAADSDNPGVCGPRRHWGAMHEGSAGFAWSWIRPATPGRIRGLGWAGPTGINFDVVADSGGVIVVGLFDPRWPWHVVLDRPGWCDTGRGAPPEWLDVLTLTSTGFDDLRLVLPEDEMVTFFAGELRRRDQGTPETLLARLRSMVGPDRWDRCAAGPQWDPPEPEPGWLGFGPDDARPPTDPAVRRTLHRSIREARGMSQSDVAALATRLLAMDDDSPAESVSVYQIHHYETGRTSRVRYLPALLDRVYGGFGWTCFEEVPVERVRPRHLVVRFPSFWTGPVSLSVEPYPAHAIAGHVTFTWRKWRLDRRLSREPVSFRFCRVPDDPPLQVITPPGWRIRAYMGFDAEALEANGDWVPAAGSEEGSEVVDDYLGHYLALIGKSLSDLQRALRICQPAGDS
ncbi:helix-turn-helix domain-containing protein [Brooklawnia cerclae]|uniref:Transcriptional regulator with XRE-family HTH domain n=1 Tax=Brooklawnia cerclae TaxID=349934 RepID=A0ABX0SH03_9ACTN|nr:transcriptional regulator with XRE-family HTH domain [Brooklawnia cerclae]